MCTDFVFVNSLGTTVVLAAFLPSWVGRRTGYQKPHRLPGFTDSARSLCPPRAATGSDVVVRSLRRLLEAVGHYWIQSGPGGLLVSDYASYSTSLLPR
jgi:hypothetical protein